jgi:hypothetical protein
MYTKVLCQCAGALELAFFYFFYHHFFVFITLTILHTSLSITLFIFLFQLTNRSNKLEPCLYPENKEKKACMAKVNWENFWWVTNPEHFQLASCMRDNKIAEDIHEWNVIT